MATLKEKIQKAEKDLQKASAANDKKSTAATRKAVIAADKKLRDLQAQVVPVVVKPKHSKTFEGFGKDMLDRKKIEGEHR